MDIFFRNKLLVRIAFLLVVLNICSIGFIWWRSLQVEDHRPPKKSVEEITAILKEELQLTEQQQEQLKAIREDFFQKESVLSALIRSQRDSMNAEMFNAHTDTIQVKAIARRVAENEYQMELYRLAQANQLKTICTPQQWLKFEGLVKEIRDYFQPRKKK